MPKDYKTVKKGACDEFTEKRSRFIGYCRPVTTEEEALEFISAVRAEHRTASHNVYAYIIRENNIMRFSDDGEPAGTAGMPVLEVLRSMELTDVAVVVTRYFGGTLLGTGGLVRAYTKGAKIGVEAACPIEKLFCNIYSVKCSYPLSGRLRYAIEEKGLYTIEDVSYTDSVEFIVSVRTPDAPAFEKLIADKSNGDAAAELYATEYVDK